MTITLDSQNFESYVPVYDTVPESWEDARPFLVEHLKKISTAVNIREIGWFLDEELLTGKAFIPGIVTNADSGTSQQFRSILRKVIDFGPIVNTIVNQRPHGIVFDSNFTLIQMWGAATRATVPLAFPIPDGVGTGSAINMDATNVNIITTVNMDRCIAVIEYIQEV